jgi:hypothetical protein
MVADVVETEKLVAFAKKEEEADAMECKVLRSDSCGVFHKTGERTGERVTGHD